MPLSNVRMWGWRWIPPEPGIGFEPHRTLTVSYLLKVKVVVVPRTGSLLLPGLIRAARRPPTVDPPMLMPGSDGHLDPGEVGALWSFLHGDIMIGGIRQQLHLSLGLCPRHTWGYIVVEIELWSYGPEPRGGHIPFDVGVLYDDLLEDVIARITSAHRPDRHGLRGILTTRTDCRICHDLGIDGAGDLVVGYAGFNADKLAAEAAEFTFTTKWCLRTREYWHDRVCSRCADPASDVAELQSENMCRQHLIELPSLSPGTARAIAMRLDEVRQRLHRFNDSMTQGGRPATVADDAAIIETLGWFAGWQFPLALSS